MTRIIQSFSVPDGSVAHAKLKQWKEEGANISAIIQMMIEGEDHTAVIRARDLKILKLKDLTNDGKRLTKKEHDDIFFAW